MTSEEELEHRSALSDARLGVAEELGWAVALLSGAVIYLKWGTWMGAVVGAMAVYYVVTYKYRKDAKKAEDEYLRAAGLGKYLRNR